MFNKNEIGKIIKSIHSYNAGCIGKPQEQPLVVVGPSGGKENLRIYCYGGAGGCLDVTEIEGSSEDEEVHKLTQEEYTEKHELVKKEYNHFLRRFYEDGHNNVYTLNKTLRSSKYYKEVLKNVPYECRMEEGKIPYIPGLDEDFLLELDKGSETIYREILHRGGKRVKYLDYVIAATENKFMNSSSEKNDKSMGERKVQTRIVKKYMQASKTQTDGYIVTDMEYRIALSGEQASKPDLIVFDGTSIGLVEVKYAGESMELNAKNSLKEHYEDFYDIIYSGIIDTREVARECWRRMDVLKKYKLINKDWWKQIDELKTKIDTIEDISSLFWMGFLFVEGPGISEKDNEEYVKEQMNKQLGSYFLKNTGKVNADVRYCYTTQEELKLDMKQGREYILKEIIKPQMTKKFGEDAS